MSGSIERAGKGPLHVLPRAAPICLALVPLVLWTWLGRDWPARLGFYSDDWMVSLHPFVGTADAYHDILNLVATRPVSAPFIWLAQVITDWDPARSQILNVAMLLISAASVGILTAALISMVPGLGRRSALAGACIASAAFIVFPSSVGTFAWQTGMTTAVPALPLFCFATSLLLHSEGSWPRLVVALVIAALSHLAYEAFYFQEITFLLLAAVLRSDDLKNIDWRAIVGVIFVNIACIVFNRVTPGGVQKSFHWDFLHSVLWAYRHLPETFGNATREHTVLIMTSMIAAGLSGAICLAHLIGAVRVPLAGALSATGIIASSFLYAFAGYPLAMEGPLARVSIVITTYYAVTSGVLAAAAWPPTARHRWPAIAFWLFAAVGLVSLELTARARVAEWADTWSYEQTRLSRLPAIVSSSELQAGGDRRIFLAIEERPRTFVEPAAAPWEIIGAVAWGSYQITKSRLLMVDRWKGTRTAPQWLATPRDWFNRWNGHSFEQGPCGGAAVYSVSGSELWLWKTSASVLSKVEAPWEYGCR